jgi:hypothetical protein
LKAIQFGYRLSGRGLKVNFMLFAIDLLFSVPPAIPQMGDSHKLKV